MSLVARRIRKELTNNYVPHVDQTGTADYLHVLSRATAALGMVIMAGYDPESGCRDVTDHGRDQGIDGVAIYGNESKLLLVQSKYTEGTSGVDLGSITKFTRGVRKIAVGDWTRFGGPILSRSAEIDDTITNYGLEIQLLIITTSDATISDDAVAALDEVCAEMGGTGQVDWRYINRSDIDTYLNSVHDNTVDLEVSILDWGKHSVDELTAYFGTLTAETVIDWSNSFGNVLFAKNIRSGLGASEVNEAISTSARSEPSRFWFFNNGITVLAESVESPQSLSRAQGRFKFTSASVVNGAQTISSLVRAAEIEPDIRETAQVFARFIIVGPGGSELAQKITRRTNTQNRVGDRDFVALDPLQDSIRRGFIDIGRTYVYRSGEYVQNADRECDLTEATIALACSVGVDEAVLAKGTLGRLWEDIRSRPYTDLFVSDIEAQGIWNRVIVMRAVERALAELRSRASGRDKLILTHGNRIILWATLQMLQLPPVTSPMQFELPDESYMQKLVGQMSRSVTRAATKLYADSYPAPLFKNQAKCREIARHVEQTQPLRAVLAGVSGS